MEPGTNVPRVFVALPNAAACFSIVGVGGDRSCKRPPSMSDHSMSLPEPMQSQHIPSQDHAKAGQRNHLHQRKGCHLFPTSLKSLVDRRVIKIEGLSSYGRMLWPNHAHGHICLQILPSSINLKRCLWFLVPHDLLWFRTLNR